MSYCIFCQNTGKCQDMPCQHCKAATHAVDLGPIEKVLAKWEAQSARGSVWDDIRFANELRAAIVAAKGKP